jgi:hypothetical protein
MDIIVGCFNRYSPSALKPWVQSIAKSGFSGHKLALIYGNGEAEKSSAEYLTKHGFEVVAKESFLKSIVVDRFRDIASYLSSHVGVYDNVISTDVGDVVFQTNPSEFLATRLIGDKQILVGSECVRYKDETWGRENMRMSFPNYSSMMMDKVIYNAGTVAVKSTTAIQFFTDIFNLSMATPVYNPDQAALNLLIQTKYHDNTYFSSMEDGWSIQCGTVTDPTRLAEYGSLLVENEHKFVDGVGYNRLGNRVCLVHQYNRVPLLVDVVKNLY